jgi:hypothetical protein
VDLTLYSSRMDRAAAAVTAFGLIAAGAVVAYLLMRRLRDDDEVLQQPIHAWRVSLGDGGQGEELS